MKKLLALHDILTAWQAGEIGYRRALELSQIETLDELYEAAELSNVPIRDRPNPDEIASARLVADLVRANARPRAA